MYARACISFYCCRIFECQHRREPTVREKKNRAGMLLQLWLPWRHCHSYIWIRNKSARRRVFKRNIYKKITAQDTEIILWLMEMMERCFDIYFVNNNQQIIHSTLMNYFTKSDIHHYWLQSLIDTTWLHGYKCNQTCYYQL